MPDDRGDRELVAAALQALPGDYRAFEELVLRHQTRIMNNCRILSGSAETAEDLAQEVFVKAYFGLRSFERRSAFRTWLQRIKVNHCLNFLKKHEGRSFVSFDDPDRMPARPGGGTERP